MNLLLRAIHNGLNSTLTLSSLILGASSALKKLKKQYGGIPDEEDQKHLGNQIYTYIFRYLISTFLVVGNLFSYRPDKFCTIY